MLDANVMILLLDLDEHVIRRAEQCFGGAACRDCLCRSSSGHYHGKGPAQDLLTALSKGYRCSRSMIEPRGVCALPFARHRFDRLIAAHALALDLTLVTANVRDFYDLPGLKVEDWTR